MYSSLLPDQAHLLGLLSQVSYTLVCRSLGSLALPLAVEEEEYNII